MDRICLLDLDGTLLDSAPDLHAALDRLMARRGLPGFSRPEVHAMIGDGVRVLVERALAARGRAFDPAAATEFLTDYEAHAADATRPFPGIPEALAALRAAGWRLAVCTNKPEHPARLVLAATGLLPLLDAVAGGDTFPTRKPDPGHLLGTLGRMGVAEVAGAVMLGDHGNDVRAARAAGIVPLFAEWGYGNPAMAEGARGVREPAELPAILAARPG
ncbi:phosphoglycolate phosphatase [Roseomonas sp. BN140053]|uniref:phosphoglycolate phosphatase n=1 Tax=Roseomonas sp. BN140053 TaxID=3391898 RepID=UPI0039EBF340